MQVWDQVPAATTVETFTGAVVLWQPVHSLLQEVTPVTVLTIDAVAFVTSCAFLSVVLWHTLHAAVAVPPAPTVVVMPEVTVWVASVPLMLLVVTWCAYVVVL
jgi:hypothetical protein